MHFFHFFSFIINYKHLFFSSALCFYTILLSFSLNSAFMSILLAVSSFISLFKSSHFIKPSSHLISANNVIFWVATWSSYNLSITYWIKSLNLLHVALPRPNSMFNIGGKLLDMAIMVSKFQPLTLSDVQLIPLESFWNWSKAIRYIFDVVKFSSIT